MTPKERQIATLERATRSANRCTIPKEAECSTCRPAAEDDYANLRAAVKALFPGKQKQRHIEPAMQVAVKAVSRVIRRRAR